jgi:phosphoribosylaminoimidazole-succinocarboxamide synthase
LPTGIPDKGKVLSQISGWWFNRTKGIVPNHLIVSDVRQYPAALQPYAALLEGRSMIVRKAKPLPIEAIVRGYLIGSGWKEYQRDGSVCSIRLRPGYQMADKLDKAIYTPSRKAETGHDENISFEETVALIGPALAAQVRNTSLELYQYARDYALSRGIIIADTKFEFGICDDKLLLIDEALTPDSSRFWPADSYRPGISPPSYDKQFVRDYLETLDWNKTPPAPALPDEVVTKTRDKYLEAFRQLTGNALSV